MAESTRDVLRALVEATDDRAGYYYGTYHICDSGCFQLGPCKRHRAIENAWQALGLSPMDRGVRALPDASEPNQPRDLIPDSPQVSRTRGTP